MIVSIGLSLHLHGLGIKTEAEYNRLLSDLHEQITYVIEPYQGRPSLDGDVDIIVVEEAGKVEGR